MTYKITIPRTRGAAYAQYASGVLQYFINELEGPLVANILPRVPLAEAELQRHTGIVVTELKPRTVSEKLAAFMMAYQQHKGVAYRPTKEERANIASVTVTPELLRVYFAANAYPLAGLKSISDYVRHYNEVRDLARNGAPRKQSFPAHPDADYEKTLSPEKLSAYRQHLHALGWRRVDGVWQQTNNEQPTTN